MNEWRGHSLAGKVPVTLKVNGNEYFIDVEPRRRLLDALREDCGLTGSKEGCGTGDCGACTVILDGKTICSCLTLAVTAKDKDITTVEGIADENGLHPIQQAFMESGGLQCGICTPGFILATKFLLERVPNPTEDQIRNWLANNLCRCTGYSKIIDAVKQAADLMADGKTTEGTR